MRIAFGPRVSEKTEQDTLLVVLTSRAASACTVDGYPLLTILDSDGRTLRFAYVHGGDEMITSTRPRPVRVRPGGSVYFAFNRNACEAPSTNRAGSSLRVALPGSRQNRAVRLPRYRPFDYCPPRFPFFNRIAVSPLQPGRFDPFCHSARTCTRRH